VVVVVRVAFGMLAAVVSLVESVATGAVLVSGAAGSAASGSIVVVAAGSGLVCATGSVGGGASCALTWVVDKARTAAIAVEAKRSCEFL
jgi:hypothetical protein